MTSHNKFDTRQSRNNAYLAMIANKANFNTDTYTELDNLLAAINNELTPAYRLFGNDPASRILNVGAGSITNSETSVRHTNNFVDKAYPAFTSGTVTLPAASGGTIVVSPTTEAAPILTLAPTQFIKILIEIDRTGNLSVRQGTAAASEAAATMPNPTPQRLQIGVLVATNTGGAIDNVIGSKIIQFANNTSLASWNEGVTSTVTAAGTTTLTSTSTSFQQFTGTALQTMKLPDATTMTAGMKILVSNRSTKVVTVTLNDNSTLTTVNGKSQRLITLTSNATTNGTWDNDPAYRASQEVIDSTATGANQDLSVPLTSYTKYTNVGLLSVRSIAAGQAGQIYEVTNGTGGPVTFNNEDLTATADNRIVTGTATNLTLENDASARFIYDFDGTTNRWRVVGGTGSGSTETGRSIPFSLLGHWNLWGTLQNVLEYRVTQNITITEFRILVGIAGASGNASLDIQRKRGAGAFTSLLLGFPSIPNTAGNYADSATGTGASAAALDPSKINLLADDILRIDIISVQAGTGVKDLLAFLYYTL